MGVCVTVDCFESAGVRETTPMRRVHETTIGSGDAFGSGGRLNTCFHVTGDRSILPD